MATRINFDDYPKTELEYIRMLHILKMPPEAISCLMTMYRKSNEITDLYGDKTVIDNPNGGRIIRKPKSNKNVELPFYDATPYGIENYKILLPKQYSFIKKKNSDEPDIETIYNICVCMKNIHFWFLLTLDQKMMVYRTLRKNPKTPLYGHRDRFATFTTLLDEIVSYILPYDGLFVKILDAYKQRTPEATDELKRLYEQNLAKIATLQAFLVHLNSIIEHDPLIASSLLYYTPILWHFVSNNVVIKDIDVNKYYINGTPPIKNISFKEYPI